MRDFLPNLFIDMMHCFTIQTKVRTKTIELE